jgi:hypothetical protein
MIDNTLHKIGKLPRRKLIALQIRSKLPVAMQHHRNAAYA